MFVLKTLIVGTIAEAFLMSNHMFTISFSMKFSIFTAEKNAK